MPLGEELLTTEVAASDAKSAYADLFLSPRRRTLQG